VSVQETVTTTPAEAAPLPTADLSLRGLVRLALGNVRQFGMLATLVLGLILFQFTTGGVMLKSLNVTNIFLQNGYIMVMVLGMLLVIVIGHIDLSVGSVAAFTGAVAAVLMTSLGLDPILAVILTLLLGALIGMWQGFWIAYLGVPSFIVTLAGLLLFRGLTLWMLGGQPVGPFDESFRAIASGFFPEVIGTVPDPFGTTEIVLGPAPLPFGGGDLHLSTLLMGASFPFVQRAVHADVLGLGRRVGWLQAANILGSTLGAVLTGLVFLHFLGSAGTMRVLVGLGSAFVALLVALGWRGAGLSRRLAGVASVGAPLVIASFLPGQATLWARLHGTSEDRVLYAEDGSGVSVLKEERLDGRAVTTVYISGIGESQLPYGGYHTVLGALPVALHPDPRSVLVIGLGSGDTLFGTGGRPETERMECVEILAPQLRTLALVDRRRPYAGLRALLRDGRVHHLAADGRALLMRGGRRYDVIQADALRPGSAYAGNLYSVEYFALMRRSLTPGGFGVSWGPTTRTRDAFLKAFPYVLVFGHTLIGSDREIAFDPEVVRARLRQPFTRAYYERAGIDVAALLGPVLDAGAQAFGPEVDRERLTDVNTDLFPKDEYLASESFLGWRKGRASETPGPDPSRARPSPRE